MKKNKINKLFFKCIILLICSYQLDINKNYKTFLTNEKIKKCLQYYQVKNDIIFYTYSNYDLSGSVYYLRNTVDSECMIVISKKTLYLVFCGTQFDLNDKVSLVKDIITDINLGIEIVQEFGTNIGIHNTYKKNLHCENLIGRIEKIVSRHLDLNIVICGHSMGCGLSVYCSMVLAKKFSNINFNLVLISAPKLGNINLNKYIENTKNLILCSMINNNEIVPLFPFYPLFPSYTNIGNKTYKYNSNGTCEIIEKISNNVFKMCSVKDHFTNSIIENIYNNIGPCEKF